MRTAYRRSRPYDRQTGKVFRWECPCQEPPVLLGTYDASGEVNLKSGDRYWHVVGQVRTICPRCGVEHLLDPQAISASTVE